MSLEPGTQDAYDCLRIKMGPLNNGEVASFRTRLTMAFWKRIWLETMG